MQTDMYQSEPNLLAEAYRNHSNLEIPRRVEKHFDFLEISNDGFFLLGTSNLCGRIWSGSIWVFDECPARADSENCFAGIELESTVASGLWIEDHKRLVIGCDSGSLYYFTLNTIANKEKHYFNTDGVITVHDDSVVTLDLMHDKRKIVSGGLDMNIIIWDAEALTNVQSYCPAHSNAVTSVSAGHEALDTFVSTSLDGTALFWDTRQKKPASLVLKDEVGLTASCWIEKYISLGSNDGSVSFVDLRKMSQKLEQNYCSQRPIYRMKHEADLHLLAVCADEPTVYVLNTDDKNFNILYKSDQHTDFVRGLAWHKPSKLLHSCGWDSQIVTHTDIMPVKS